MALEIFRESLREKAIGGIIVSIVLFLVLFYTAAQYNSIAGMTSLNELLNNPAIKALVGNLTDVTSFEGYLFSKGFVMMSMVIGGYLGFVTASFLAGEIERNTVDFLLSLPASRTAIVLSRFAVLVPVVALFLVAEFAAVALGARVVNVETSIPWLACALAFQGLFALAVGAMTMLISAVLNDGRRAALISLGVVLVMYFVETVGSTVEGLDAIRYLSVFHYQALSDVFINHTIDAGNVAALIVLTAVFLGLAVLTFGRKEILA